MRAPVTVAISPAAVNPNGCVDLGKAEVENFHLTVGGEEDVVRLEVAMSDAAVVGGGEAAQDSECEFHRFAQRQRSAVDPLAQGAAGEELGHDERRAAGRPDVVHRDDVGMIQGGRRPRFLLEPRDAVGIVGHRRGQNLDGDVAMQSGIDRAVDLAHPAFAERAANLVGPEPGSWRQRHGDGGQAPGARPGPERSSRGLGWQCKGRRHSTRLRVPGFTVCPRSRVHGLTCPDSTEYHGADPALPGLTPTTPKNKKAAACRGFF